MRKTSSLFFLTLLLCSAQLLSAQEISTPNDLRPQLQNLSAEQKQKTLEYVRSLNTMSVEQQIQFAYEQLGADGRAKAAQFVNTFHQGDLKANRTTVRWYSDTLHFGAVEEGTILLDSFTVVNTGRNPYLISSTKASCDCTVLKVPSKPILPGEIASVRVEFNSRGKSGKTLAGLVVYDNSSPNLRNILYLEGTVVPRKPPGKN